MYIYYFNVYEFSIINVSFSNINLNISECHFLQNLQIHFSHEKRILISTSS